MSVIPLLTVDLVGVTLAQISSARGSHTNRDTATFFVRVGTTKFNFWNHVSLMRFLNPVVPFYLFYLWLISLPLPTTLFRMPCILICILSAFRLDPRGLACSVGDILIRVICAFPIIYVCFVLRDRLMLAVKKLLGLRRQQDVWRYSLFRICLESTFRYYLTLEKNMKMIPKTLYPSILPHVPVRTIKDTVTRASRRI